MDEKNTPAGEQTFEQQVNAVVGEMTQNEEGKWVTPEGVSEAMGYAAMAERRRRDTQAAFTKTQQEAETLKAENSRLAAAWQKDAVSMLPQADQDRLTELKFADPDAWRLEIARVEAEQVNKFTERRDAVSTEAYKETELQRRSRLITEYNTANPERQITDQAIDDEVPPKYMKQFESGELTFDEFMDTCAKFISSNKVIQSGEEVPRSPDLSKLPGSERPTDNAIQGDIKQSYKNETY